jgi:hypothetical protein
MDIEPLVVPGVIALMTVFLIVLGAAALYSRDAK